jgi:hypothetical protein
VVGVIGTGNDTWTLLNDTITTTLQDACVRATSATSVTLTASWFQRCTARTPHAVTSGGGSLRVQQSTFVDNRAAVASSGSSFTAIGNSISVEGFCPVRGDTLLAQGHSKRWRDHHDRAEHRDRACVQRGRSHGGSVARLDSNFISTNAIGVRLGALGNFSARDNDIFDNAAAGVANEVGPASSADLVGTDAGRAGAPIRPQRATV